MSRSLACVVLLLLAGATWISPAVAQSVSKKQTAAKKNTPQKSAETAQGVSKKQAAVKKKSPQKPAAKAQGVLKKQAAVKKKTPQKSAEAAKVVSKKLAATKKKTPQESSLERRIAVLEQHVKALMKKIGELEGRSNKGAATGPHSSDTQLKLFALQYTDATSVVDVIRTILDAGDPKKKLRIAVDQRTNQVIVSGDKTNLDIIEALLLRLDEPVEPKKKQ